MFQYLKAEIEKRTKNEEECFQHLIDVLQREVAEEYRGKKLPSLKDQLADV